jgi:two-component system, OmpR family, sensor histidine kinase MprB
VTNETIRVRKSRLRLRTRIALFAAVAVGTAISLTAVIVYFVVRAELYDQFDTDLTSRAQAVGQAVADPDLLTRIPVELLDNAQVGLLRADNVMFPARGGQTPPSSDVELAVAQGKASSSIRDVVVGGESMRVAAVPAGDGQALLFALPSEPVDSTLHQLALLLLFVGLLGVAGAAAAGYAVARTGLRPVAELTAAAERVARTDDLTPIEVRSDDELGRLATSFNAMLLSLDASRDRERRLVADAGHELRTPLTSIRTNLDLLAQSQQSGVELSAPDRESLLTDVREQIAELGDLIGDLVQLSRGISGSSTEDTFDLAVALDRSLERIRRRATGLTLDVEDSPWWVCGDSALVERALTNLLDNAVKWSPPGGTITVRLDQGTLSVADEGPGIPQDDQDRVFERFYRAPTARGLPGSGLGLAIVAQTAQQLGGSVQASSAPAGGALLTLRLPGATQEPRDDE